MNREIPLSTRRAFLHKGLTLVAAAATVPAFLDETAWALGKPWDDPLVADPPGVPNGRILVLIQLAGGNDGLNTVIPFKNDKYYQLRPRLAIPAKKVLRLKGDLGLHPDAAHLKELYDAGRMAVVQGVGYPNPNRSHFASTDIWERASTERRYRNGWVGRYFDHACSGTDPCPADSAVALTEELPLALMGDRFQGTAFTNPWALKWNGPTDPFMRRAFQKLNEPGPEEGSGNGEGDPLSYLTRTALDARLNAAKVRAALGSEGTGDYPDTQFGRALSAVSRLIAADTPTRIYYVSLGTFDTHSDQLGRHQGLIRQLSSGMKAFFDEMEAQGNLDRVLAMTFSEFGRRVKENASRGTDHGAAAPLFLFGSRIDAGVHGRHPSLARLKDGDLIHTVDFRRIYASVIEDWMGGDPEEVLGGRFKPLRIIRG